MDVHGWAALATVLLVVEGFIMCLVAGIVLYYLNRGVAYVRRELPRAFAGGRYYLGMAQQMADRGARRVIAPVTAAEAFAARVGGLGAGVQKLFTSRNPFDGKEH